MNEALSLLDGLLHCAVEAVSAVPPAIPANGSAWLVGAGASGEWTGREGQLALRQSEQWLYVLPRNGVRVLNKATGQDLRRVGDTWVGAAAPASATGGAVIDAEARTMLDALVAALRQAGVFTA